MIQVVLNINGKQRWNAVKTILEVMDIDYMIQDTIEKMSEKELELLYHAKSDHENNRVNIYTSHRDILGRQ